MDPAPSRKQLTHDRILDAAARALRETGFHGVGVADIMKRAGLTHGGFYAHFPSRDALIVEALQRAGEDSQGRLQRSMAAGEARAGSRFRALVESYLSETHLKAADRGCPVAALLSDVPRQSDAVRAAAGDRIASLIARVAAALGPDAPPDAAAIVASQMVGALQIARALGDNALGRRHLASNRRFLLERFDAGAAREAR
ncbi:TetR/AcrR family transcriptional regulator [Ramlibacter sp. USB13]|uniref:TetR/AcrR family transcriptional regulator n=1 Tax=Ramlibacter cellulosilyticus TaxID=2764187 RepID=A0A923SHC6_9BURK|nr:TetR/AcrR family transcriptional regulator [Ramlibacter cellulosilyticus]MBC5785772.1 TetR/AcrR family transcriptional regulator [Ramlibacter cellulosilyticus]